MGCLIIFASFNPAWAGNQKIVVTCTEWEPYTSEKLLNGGFLIELTVESLKRVGYDVEVKYLPWARALDEVKNGRYQALDEGMNSLKKDGTYIRILKKHNMQ